MMDFWGVLRLMGLMSGSILCAPRGSGIMQTMRLVMCVLLSAHHVLDLLFQNVQLANPLITSTSKPQHA
ncbi:MAG: hypothetical protein QF704_11800 [Anaerolineales bacterium]|nr:hypothetical protein [Anaerolineales bacterium]